MCKRENERRRERERKEKINVCVREIESGGIERESEREK